MLSGFASNPRMLYKIRRISPCKINRTITLQYNTTQSCWLEGNLNSFVSDIFHPPGKLFSQTMKRSTGSSTLAIFRNTSSYLKLRYVPVQYDCSQVSHI